MENFEDIFKKALIKEIPFGDKEDLDKIISYLIQRNFISSKTIQRFSVLKEFERLLPENDFHRTNTVLSISNIYNISERTIWSVLKTYSNKYKL